MSERAVAMPLSVLHTSGSEMHYMKECIEKEWAFSAGTSLS
jgi:hypothetical protein